jgi:hypothetical protein
MGRREEHPQISQISAEQDPGSHTPENRKTVTLVCLHLHHHQHRVIGLLILAEEFSPPSPHQYPTRQSANFNHLIILHLRESFCICGFGLFFIP